MRESRSDSGALDALTRQEWNAAYFLGLERMFRLDGPDTFAAQMKEGHRLLIEAGHRATPCDGVTGDPGTRPAPSGEHDRSCREILDGTFDPIGRAREALAWIEGNVPRVNTDWLRALLSVYDDSREPHPAPLPDGLRAVESVGSPGGGIVPPVAASGTEVGGGCGLAVQGAGRAARTRS